MAKNPLANAGDLRDVESTHWVRKIPWRRAWQPTPEFFLEKPVDRGASGALVHRVAKSRT